MQDRRLVNRLKNYWDLICRGRAMPEIQQLNPATIDDLWQQCMQMEVLHTQGGTSYGVRFMGGQLVEMYGHDLTSQMLDKKITRYPLNIVVSKLDVVAKTPEFLIDENQFINERGKVVKYRACFMPFGNETKGLTHIVAGYSGREF